MKMSKAVISLSVLMGINLLPNIVLANDNTSFGYFGISHKFNSSDNVNFQTSIDEQSTLDSNYSLSQSGSGNRLFFGYQTNEYFALEIGYENSVNGRFSYTNVDSTQITGTSSATAWDVRLIGTRMFTGNFFVKGAVGHKFWHQKVDQLIDENDIYKSETMFSDGDGMMMSIGLGLGISRTKALAIDFESVEIEDNQVNSLVLSYVGKF